MKKLIVLILMLSLAGFAQQQEETVTIKKSELTAEQRAKVEADNLRTKANQYGEWVGIGKEIGVAVNDGLTAVTAQANNFAQTPVGKVTVAVIVFKVIGKQLIGLIVAFTMTIIFIPLWVWSYKRYMPGRKYLKKEIVGPDNKVIERQYGVTELCYDTSDWLIGHWVIFGAFVVVNLFVIFA
jgi:hypothetical protein